MTISKLNQPGHIPMAELSKAKIAPAFKSAEQAGLKSAAPRSEQRQDGNNLPTFIKPGVDAAIDGYQTDGYQTDRHQRGTSIALPEQP
ncbi:MAG: hypothetical protein KME45_09975 [Stenomitos rutilans HA7619-LM2]|jgi:hypothetical protein|nr:hypothetical protein [Stenomitos rutilans HA7619-LM2]